MWTKGPNAPRKTLPKELDVNLKKDFGLMAGGFPGGEVGLSSFLDSGKIPKRANPPSVGAGAVVAVAAAVVRAARHTNTRQTSRGHPLSPLSFPSHFHIIPFIHPCFHPHPYPVL